MEKETFGRFLWETRKEKLRLTREALASRLNISSTHLYNLERGNRFPSRELVINIATELNVPSEYLFQLLAGNNVIIQNEKPKSRIPDLPPDDPPLSQEKLDLLNDPRIGLMFSRSTLAQLTNRQLNQIVSQIEFYLEENEELKKLIQQGKSQNGTSL